MRTTELTEVVGELKEIGQATDNLLDAIVNNKSTGDTTLTSNKGLSSSYFKQKAGIDLDFSSDGQRAANLAAMSIILPEFEVSSQLRTSPLEKETSLARKQAQKLDRV